jgi:hypothetical protein
VTAYLPYFKLDEPRAGDITIQQLLSLLTKQLLSKSIEK